MAVAKAKDFLESNTYSAEDPYSTALSAYALALLRSPYAPLALRRLNHMAITQGSATCTAASAQPESRVHGSWGLLARCFTRCVCVGGGMQMFDYRVVLPFFLGLYAGICHG